MINKVEVIDGGDTHYMPGDLVPYNRVIKINEEIKIKIHQLKKQRNRNW